ncbi:hypothetical protein QCA50_015915 [Cerrena zonata]|uniref:Uncharacterized protein n=1 Tax=Cerrena zonata TaxID=2478898 RepID=A0AAW0FP65_9APHY
MTNQQDLWNNQQRPLGQPFNGRQHPPVLPPPATLEAGGQSFYPLPSLPSLGNGAGHPQPGHGFTIPSINPGNDSIHSHDQSRHNQGIRRHSGVSIPGQSQQLPPPSSIAPTPNSVNASLATPTSSALPLATAPSVSQPQGVSAEQQAQAHQQAQAQQAQAHKPRPKPNNNKFNSNNKLLQWWPHNLPFLKVS